MNENIRYEIRSHGEEYLTGYFENNFYYERGANNTTRPGGKAEGNLFYYKGGVEPAVTIEGLILTRTEDGVV